MSQFFQGFQQPYGQYPAPRYQQPMQGYMQQPAQRGVNFFRVSGLEGAKAFPMGPNEQAVLFDDNRDVFYFKSTDSGGYPTIQPCSYSLMREDAPTAPDYVTRAEFDELKEMITNGIKPVRKAAKQPAAEPEE